MWGLIISGAYETSDQSKGGGPKGQGGAVERPPRRGWISALGAVVVLAVAGVVGYANGCGPAQQQRVTSAGVDCAQAVTTLAVICSIGCAEAEFPKECVVDCARTAVVAELPGCAVALAAALEEVSPAPAPFGQAEDVAPAAPSVPGADPPSDTGPKKNDTGD